MHILIIEDEPKVAGFIKKGLEQYQFLSDVAQNGQMAEDLLRNHTFDLVLLDVLLPDTNGVELCKTIRKMNPKIPILMLTALGTLDDKVRGLDAGADDYLVKPFHFKELMARIRALTRRNVNNSESNILFVDDLQLDLNTKKVSRAGGEIKLTAREFNLLEVLIRNKERVLSRAQIAEHLWEEEFLNGSNIVDVYINYLRRKIDKKFDKKLIHTIIGMGYVIRE
ncbi:response regulator transcription factor [Natronoflexus pectinivorans]|uniref:DNA-binding response OmpR family regulator n=1 Tax=Natronoflexus pectinivorans TaxID=682526 RepID=A0A4R2GKU4_9BACT|nr:response regulator transcription factor [Natronoflexus pectinivorans]TCO09187.1 DNA-binding response OmpR family regulator [Natronoflexus pectinivorans]